MTLAAAKTGGNGSDIQIFCPLVKVDAAKREVWGIVTAEAPDRENEICDYDTTAPYYKEVVDEMSKATDGVNIFPLRAMHGLIAAGKGISIEFRKEAKQIYMGFKVVDDAEWKKCEEGVYTGFSQGGRYVKKWKDGDYTRYTAKPGEVSLVDIPCLPTAHFDYVKADGTVEMRKFTTSATPQPNPEPKEKAVKYLVEEGGKQFLPYTKSDGTSDLRLMRAAWNQLHGIRGKSYTGPNKDQAIKRLKQLFAAQGLDNPAEKAERVEGLLKGILESTINSRAYGYLGKGMYNIARFATIIDDLKYLWISLEYERSEENESIATDELKSIFTSLLANFLAYAEEEIEEITAHAAAFEPGGLAMSGKAADLLKAALGKDDMAMAAYFKASAAVHKGMAEDHEKMASAHKAHGELHEGQMGKAADDAKKDYHKASSEYHKSMSSHHEGLGKRHADHAADLDKAAKDADEATDADKKKKEKEAKDAEDEKNKKVAKSGAEMSEQTTVQPGAVAAAQSQPAAGAANAAAPASPESDLSKTLEKSLDDRLGKAIGEAIDRVLASQDFSKTLDSKLAAKMLEKLGGTPAPTELRSIAIPRAGDTGSNGVVKSGSPQNIVATDGSKPDPQFAALCSIEGN